MQLDTQFRERPPPHAAAQHRMDAVKGVGFTLAPRHLAQPSQACKTLSHRQAIHWGHDEMEGRGGGVIILIYSEILGYPKPRN